MSTEKQETRVTGVHYTLEKPLEETMLYDKLTPQIARITFNRPQKHNAWYYPDMDHYCCTLIERAVDDDDVKVIIVRGSGPSFCTGDDLNRAPAEAFGLQPGQKLSQMHRLRGWSKIYHGAYDALLYCPKNTIASVHGWATGAGFTLAEHCDLIVAAESAKFCQNEQRIGFGGMTSIMDILHLGPKRARELMLSGGTLSAEKAKDWGLVNSVVPDEQLEEETLRWAKMISLHAADGLMTQKMLMRNIYEIMGVGAAYQAQMTHHALFTNLVWQPDEMNFLKLRTQVGAREAFRLREERWSDLGF